MHEDGSPRIQNHEPQMQKNIRARWEAQGAVLGKYHALVGLAARNLRINIPGAVRAQGAICSKYRRRC